MDSKETQQPSKTCTICFGYNFYSFFLFSFDMHLIAGVCCILSSLVIRRRQHIHHGQVIGPSEGNTHTLYSHTHTYEQFTVLNQKIYPWYNKDSSWGPSRSRVALANIVVPYHQLLNYKLTHRVVSVTLPVAV